jgi:predicted TPR repeat methyltransferase
MDGNDAEAPETRAQALTLKGIGALQAGDVQAALGAFQGAASLTPDDPLTWRHLALPLLTLGQFEGARTALVRARDLNPSEPGTHETLGLCELVLAARRDDWDPAAAARAAEAAGAGADEVLKAALLLLEAAGEQPAAGRIGAAWAELRPDNPEARHLRDAALGRYVARQPPELVVQRFDEMAEVFDEQLVGRLGYRGPEHLGRLLEARLPQSASLEVLDLGCGTGLCGETLRPYARRLVGLDLSPGMLAKARERGLYDQLVEADLFEALDGTFAWDLLCAFDALPYLGELEALFAGAARSLAPGGLFAVSTERAEGDGFVLRGSGRYAHADAYLHRLAVPAFEVAGYEAAPIRLEAGRPLPGGYHLFRRRDAV